MIDVNHQVTISSNQGLLVNERDLTVIKHQIKSVDWNLVSISWYISRCNLLPTAWHIYLSAMLWIDLRKHLFKFKL